MDIKILAKSCLTKLVDAGVDLASVSVINSQKHELQKDYDVISLSRNTDEISIQLRVIDDQREGTQAFNYTSDADIDTYIAKVVETAKNSKQDKAFAMAENTVESKSFGATTPDLDLMYSLLDAFIKEKDEKYPEIKDTSTIFFESSHSYTLNNKGVELEFKNGYYGAVSIFTAVRDAKSSSLNYTFNVIPELPEALMKVGRFEQVFQETIEQIDQKIFDDKFEGEVILSPEAVGFCVQMMLAELGGLDLVNKTSKFQDDLHKKVFHEKLTLKATPMNPDLAIKALANQEGFLYKEDYIIKNGVINSFFVNQYVANKTGLERTDLSPSPAIIENGDTKFEDMVKGIKKGILINRISGGNPNKNKDFSAIAKNSYYIEDGKILYPINEVMVTANIINMLQNIIEVSQETLNFGESIVPWIKCAGVTVSGK
ncbi:MAG: hypothetical protein B6226_03825 [Candidatus Cloacimonetes bacterium 4572_65]|nr:MAG: hypothetical protein B6226_03825 [Candidatus Cloacimonetes bacterium 4572_65]